MMLEIFYLLFGYFCGKEYTGQKWKCLYSQLSFCVSTYIFPSNQFVYVVTI